MKKFFKHVNRVVVIISISAIWRLLLDIGHPRLATIASPVLPEYLQRPSLGRRTSLCLLLGIKLWIGANVLKNQIIVMSNFIEIDAEQLSTSKCNRQKDRKTYRRINNISID